MPLAAGCQAGTAPRDSGEADEWATLRAFRDGDSPRQVAWKAYAHGAPLLVKEYTASGSAERLFEYAALTGLDTEQRLSQLTRWIVKSAAAGERFGLALPKRLIELDQGQVHRQRCLRALARFGTEPSLAVIDQPAAHRRATYWMIGAFVLGALLHLGQAPIWVILLACGGGSVGPGRGARTRATAGASPESLTHPGAHGDGLALFHTLNGLNAGSALLVLMGAIKLLEARSRRDRLIVVGVAFYLLLAACLVSQELLRAPLYLLQAWVCCTALLYAAHPDAPVTSRSAGWLSARSLGLAVPLALLLFALFPRLAGSFWSLGGPGQAQTGLSDTMSPGSISELGTSVDPVFRVWFTGPLPPPQERYWRGPVLHDFDGYTWTRAHGDHFKAENLEYLGPAYQYQIRLEPDSTPWWPALDIVQSAKAQGAAVTPDRQLLAYRPVHDEVSYTAVSYTATQSHDTLSHIARAFDTDLVPNRNLRSQALAHRMRAAAPQCCGLCRRRPRPVPQRRL